MAPSDEQDFLIRFLVEEPLLRAFLLSATGRLHASEDLLQTIATVLWEKREQFDATQPFRPWVLGIARLEVLKWRQSLARCKEVLCEESILLLADSVVQHAEELDQRRHYLQECIELLDDRQQNVLRMKYGHGFGIAAIAARVGKSVAAVEMLLVRLRRTLRACIEKKAARASKEWQ